MQLITGKICYSLTLGSLISVPSSLIFFKKISKFPSSTFLFILSKCPHIPPPTHPSRLLGNPPHPPPFIRDPRVKSSLLFDTFYCLFCFYTNSLRLNSLKTKKAMNAKFAGFVIYAKVITYLLLCNLHDCTFKSGSRHLFTTQKK